MLTVLVGQIQQAYANLLDAAGPLKYPTSDELGCPRITCRFNRFQTGNIYWSPTPGAHEVHGAIFAEYGRQGYENSRFRLPTTGEFVVPGGRQVNFQGGWIKWLSAGNRIVTS